MASLEEENRALKEQIALANLILDNFVAWDGYDDCGLEDCEECAFERLLAQYKEKYPNE